MLEFLLVFLCLCSYINFICNNASGYSQLKAFVQNQNMSSYINTYKLQTYDSGPAHYPDTSDIRKKYLSAMRSTKPGEENKCE